jgi:DNA mismatch endonuclease, patch repair protein
MAAVKSRDTGPELALRRGLHARGLRYRLHAEGLPGKPDLVFAKSRAVVFMHGCFWHAHDCGACRIPQTRREYWTAKIERNRRRDRLAARALVAAGWRVGTVWECALRGPSKLPAEEVSERVAEWLRGERPRLNVGGRRVKTRPERAADAGERPR